MATLSHEQKTQFEAIGQKRTRVISPSVAIAPWYLAAAGIRTDQEIRTMMQL